MSGGDSTVIGRINGVMTSVAVKAPVAAIAITPITLSGLQTVGGIALLETSPPTRVLVAGQADPTTNGIYDVSAVAWLRSVDFDGAYDAVQGTRVFVYAGTGGGAEYFLTTPNPVIFGQSQITFGPFSIIPPVVTPTTFGAVADAVQLLDVKLTGNVLESASAAWTADDVGKQIVINGPGPNNTTPAGGVYAGQLVTTIASVSAAGAAKTAAIASTNVTNATAIYGTDDSAAIVNFFAYISANKIVGTFAPGAYFMNHPTSLQTISWTSNCPIFGYGATVYWGHYGSDGFGYRVQAGASSVNQVFVGFASLNGGYASQGASQSNCYFYSVVGDGTNNVRVGFEDSTVQNMKGPAAILAGKDCILKGNTFKNIGDQLYLNVSPTDPQLGRSQGVQFTGKVSKAIVHDNQFINCAQTGLQFFQCASIIGEPIAKVSFNFFKDNGYSASNAEQCAGAVEYAWNTLTFSAGLTTDYSHPYVGFLAGGATELVYDNNNTEGCYLGAGLSKVPSNDPEIAAYMCQSYTVTNHRGKGSSIGYFNRSRGATTNVACRTVFKNVEYTAFTATAHGLTGTAASPPAPGVCSRIDFEGMLGSSSFSLTTGELGTYILVNFNKLNNLGPTVVLNATTATTNWDINFNGPVPLVNATFTPTNTNIHCFCPQYIGTFAGANSIAAATLGFGARVFITDSTTNTPGAIISGGGTHPVPGFSDNVNFLVGG